MIKRSALMMACISAFLLMGCGTSNSTPPPQEQQKVTSPNGEPDKAESSLPSEEQKQEQKEQTKPDSHKKMDQAVAFPEVIDNAMKPFKSNPPLPLLAPSELPAPLTSSTDVKLKSWTTAEPPSYFVQFLNAKGTPLAGYSGIKYSSSEKAIASFYVSGYWDPSQPLAKGKLDVDSVSLGDDITGKSYTFTASAPSAKHPDKYASIVWREGRWSIEVINQESLDLPLSVAKDIVSYLHTHFLPVPEQQGAVVITIEPNNKPVDTQTLVTWQKGDRIYQTESFSQNIDDVLTALQLAVSMKPYEF